MSKENLTGTKASEKLKELTESARICMFCTRLDQQPSESRPMALQETDEEGNLWFISSADSTKNMDIKKDEKVQLYFMNNGSSEYVSVYGTAKIYTDRATIEDKWSAMANAWFDGKEDPNVSILKVTPESCYYWDTKNGKLVSMLSFLAAAVTGKKSDGSDGVEGTLNV